MSKGATLFLALLMLCTFPIWIGLFAGGFGIIIGLFGALFGVVAGVFGAIVGIIGALFEGIFGGIFGWSHDWNIFSWPHFHIGRFEIVVIIIIIALVLNRRKSVKDKNAND